MVLGDLFESLDKENPETESLLVLNPGTDLGTVSWCMVRLGFLRE